MSKALRVAFIHPDLGIGGAERLVVDAAIGLQALGHSVILYTSHHDINHCFEETRNGQLEVRYVVPPFPRSIMGKFHILLAHARQLHLVLHLLWPWGSKYDVFFVDLLSTCVPFLRTFAWTPVVFYCHFPDKLLANGEFVEGNLNERVGLLKRIYRYPMDWLEEVTTRQADVILSNSNFTARVFASYFPSIRRTPTTVYPGINISAYETLIDASDPDIANVSSETPTLLSLNRFEKKKNVALAIASFASLRARLSELPKMRLVLGGGYDPRLEDNRQTLSALIDLVRSHSLTFNVTTASSSSIQLPLNTTPNNPDVLFLLNFSTEQRTALLTATSTRALLYTPANEHFGIVPVEAMCCGLPVLACNSGGPTESIVNEPAAERTGWLCPPDPELWADALAEIVSMTPAERLAISRRAKERARLLFGMDAMASRIEHALRAAVALGTPDSRVIWWIMVLGFIIVSLLSLRVM
ncbi:mannosyltransferase [Mycena pura]|uniref:Alpha-1,3/1,6-mannosyltransferase ALG2 n=1 Tax=Mycena pura TaxID=153505 RepID=A0AAD6V1F1_9AGAR|nr:mannosyltransferase [Mycena pura]